MFLLTLLSLTLSTFFVLRCTSEFVEATEADFPVGDLGGAVSGDAGETSTQTAG